MSRVFWDTPLFLYLAADQRKQAEQVTKLLRHMSERNDQLYASYLTYAEVLTRPLQAANTSLADSIADLLSRHVALVPFDEGAARLYAQIRRDGSLSAADALQLACAARVKADLFVASDERLSQKVVPGIQFIVSLERAPM
jgi:predicted nucleic acid-binding protein